MIAEKIIDTVLNNSKISKKELVNGSRKRNSVDARRIVATLLRKKLGLNLKTIGECIYKDHSTVLYYLGQHDGLMEYDKMYKDLYKECEGCIGLDDIIKNSFHKQALEMETRLNSMLESLKKLIKFIENEKYKKD